MRKALLFHFYKVQLQNICSVSTSYFFKFKHSKPTNLFYHFPKSIKSFIYRMKTFLWPICHIQKEEHMHPLREVLEFILQSRLAFIFNFG